MAESKSAVFGDDRRSSGFGFRNFLDQFPQLLLSRESSKAYCWSVIVLSKCIDRASYIAA